MLRIMIYSLFSRSPINFLVNLLSGLIAYCHQPKKPSLGVQLLTLAQG